MVKFQKCDRLMAHQKNGEVENEKGVEKKTLKINNKRFAKIKKCDRLMAHQK